MHQTDRSKFVISVALAAFFLLFLANPGLSAEKGGEKNQGPPPVPVRVAPVTQDTVSKQITLVGTTEPIARSIIAAEVRGLVEYFPVREGDLVTRGKMLARLRATNLMLRLKGAIAAKEKVRASLAFAEKELARYTKLKDTDSIAARKYDEILYQHRSLKQELLRNDAEIELLKDDIDKKKVTAPFAGFVAKEHTQVGEWVSAGGPVVTLVDLRHVRITVDVPERYVTELAEQSSVRVLVASVSTEPFMGKISAILPEGDTDARTFPVRVRLPNPGLKIKSGMEAKATFNLGIKKKSLLVPKDAIVTAGTNRLVFVIASNVAQAVNVQIVGYYDGNVAVEGPLKPESCVVIRGNERLQPGQVVQILE